MEFKGEESAITERQKEVLSIYRSFNRINKHKMEPIPVCIVPINLK
jgi:NAD+ synthase